MVGGGGGGGGLESQNDDKKCDLLLQYLLQNYAEKSRKDIHSRQTIHD